MRKFKIWVEQWMIVSFAILTGIVIEGVLFHIIDGDPLSGFSLNWYQLLSVVLAGMVCGIPTVFFIMDETALKLPFPVRVILHCLSVYLVVLVMGKVFGWFTSFYGFLMLTVIFILVYVFVWMVTSWLHKKEDEKINQALDDIRDEE